MARKPKVGIDYFSHDVDTISDRKIKLLKSKHGMLGYAVYMRLLEEIYKEHGYYMHIEEENVLIFSDDNKMEYEKTMSIIGDCVKYDLFDDKLYKKYSILTSRRIQENYMVACERRTEVNLVKEYMLINDIDQYKNKDNVNINAINDDKNKVNGSKSTQSILKHNIEEQSKEEYVDFVAWFIKNYLGPKTKHVRDKKLEKIINKHGTEELKRAVQRYMKERKELDGGVIKKQYVKHESTWWNGAYTDYLDKNYQEKANDQNGNKPRYIPVTRL